MPSFTHLLLSGQSFPLHPPPTDSHSLPCTSLFRAPTLVKYHRRSDPLGAFRLYNHGVLLHMLRCKAPQPTSHKAVIRHRQSTDAMFEVGRSLFYTQYRAASNSCGPDPGPQVPCKCGHAYTPAEASAAVAPAVDEHAGAAFRVGYLMALHGFARSSVVSAAVHVSGLGGGGNGRRGQLPTAPRQRAEPHHAVQPPQARSKELVGEERRKWHRQMARPRAQVEPMGWCGGVAGPLGRWVSF